MRLWANPPWQVTHTVGPPIDAILLVKPEPEHYNLLSVGLKAVNPTTWIKKTNYPEQEFQPSLQAFTAQRAELLAMLKPLAPEAWSRMATVTGAGKPRERTVHTYAQWPANHERSHIKQIERIVNTPRR